MLNVLELFGGIGACTKALKKLGISFKVVDYVEIDKYAVKSYNAINETNFEPQDICTWDKDIKVDLIMHGSPCQDFSLAGKQAGGDLGTGTRSSLMWHTVRIVEKLKPKYVVWENVKNLLSKKHRHNFDAYLQKMESLGYSNYYQVLNAKDYGIPQNRERVFTVSILDGSDYEFPQKVECNNEINMINIPQMVKVRKYNVDVENLKKELKKNKCYTNKEIALIFDKPLTLVEHWFRNDNSFSIPDADVWFKLKALLKINTNEFDDSITTFEEKQNVYEKSDRFYFDDGLAPTLTSSGCNEKIIQTFSFPPKQELKLKLKDMLEDEVDEKYYLKKTNNLVVGDTRVSWDNSGKGYGSQQDRAYYQDGLCPTLSCCNNNGDKSQVVLKDKKDCVNDKPKVIGGIGEKKSNGGAQWYQQDRIYDNSIGLSLSTTALPYYPDNKLRIRKLTPKECWRLMGFDDTDFEKAKKVNSNAQLYKQAGNSIVVNVLVNIFTNLFKNMEVKNVEKKEEKKVIEYDTDKMIDVAKLLEKEPELFEELTKDYPVEPNTSLIFNVKESA